MPVQAREVQRRATRQVARLDFCPPVEQLIDHLRVAVERGEMQRRVPCAVAQVQQIAPRARGHAQVPRGMRAVAPVARVMMIVMSLKEA